MRLNLNKPTEKIHTEGGVRAVKINAVQQLRRSVMSCLLWESEFYEDGQSIADRISEFAKQVDTPKLIEIAVEARQVHGLRHVPLLLLCEISSRKVGRVAEEAIFDTIARPDEMGELIAVYWRDGKKPLPAAMKRGLARTFHKFNAYSLAKHDKNRAALSLRDVMRLTHPKAGEGNSELFNQIATDTLPTPDTWETQLSAGADKKETFTRLLTEGKLGYMALLRNLRNMLQAGVEADLVNDAIIARKGSRFVLPFRYVAAARAAPVFEPAIDRALQSCVEEMAPLPGTTIVLVDVSGSMTHTLSGKSDLRRMDAAAALAVILPVDPIKKQVFSFSTRTVRVPSRGGMGGIDAILNSQQHSSTNLVEAIAQANNIPHDRLVVITDEQATAGLNGLRRWGGSSMSTPTPVAKHAYMLNVASARNGVGYPSTGWTHIDGFSESVVRFMHEHENFED